jgi:hypothetical protein
MVLLQVALQVAERKPQGARRNRQADIGNRLSGALCHAAITDGK